MECDCALRSKDCDVFTCPICSSKAYRALCFLSSELTSQLDLFEEGESVSVSAYIGLLDEEFEQTKFADHPEDGLPF